MIQRVFGLIVVISLISIPFSIPAPARAQDETSWFLGEVNALRASVGLSPYSLNAQLSAAAARQSQYLAETCNITHTWPDGTTPADRALQAGYTGGLISENIFAGSNARPVDAWTFWVNSPIHYNGLVHGALDEVGIGIAHGGYCGNAYTMVFGRSGASIAPSSSGSDNAGGSDSADDSISVVAAPPVYVPPPPSNTPTPTIPTLTPSATWTITPTHTPTTTGAPPTATGTALVLPTVPALNQRASATPTPPPTDSPVPDESDESDEPEAAGQAVAAVNSPVPPTGTPRPEASVAVTTTVDEDDGGLKARDLVPVALAVQIVLIGAVGFWYFRRTQ